MSKQSNKQSQNVKVIVNNKISPQCCEKPKRKRRTQPKQEEEAPVDEFPAMFTPQSRSGTMPISALPNRNSVYIPPTIQISNTSQPVPSYFESHYTNLTRTLQDFAEMLRKEQQDVNDLVNIDTQTDIADPTSAVSPQAKDSFNNPLFTTPRRPELKMSEPQMNYDITNEPLPTTSSTPVKDLISAFESSTDKRASESDAVGSQKPATPTAPTTSMELIKQHGSYSAEKMRNKLYDYTIDDLKETYYHMIGGRGRGAEFKHKPALINKIVAKMYIKKST